MTMISLSLTVAVVFLSQLFLLRVEIVKGWSTSTMYKQEIKYRSFSSHRPIVPDSMNAQDRKIPRIAQIAAKEQGLSKGKEFVSPNNLRIIGGTFRGRHIMSPKVFLRPMMSKVRAALFSSLTSILTASPNCFQNTKVLDLYAGSGSVGLEALSRGASHVTFVDLSPDCTQTCLRNAVICGIGTNKGVVRAVTCRAESFLATPSKFPSEDHYDLVVLSPPYTEVSYPTLLDTIASSSLLCPNSLVVVEYPRELGSLPPDVQGGTLLGLKNRRYGRTVLAMYVYKPTRQYNFNLDEFSEAHTAKWKKGRKRIAVT